MASGQCEEGPITDFAVKKLINQGWLIRVRQNWRTATWFCTWANSSHFPPSFKFKMSLPESSLSWWVWWGLASRSPVVQPDTFSSETGSKGGNPKYTRACVWGPDSATELTIVCETLCVTVSSAYQAKRFPTQVLVHPLQTQLILPQILKFPNCLASFQAFTLGHFTNASLIHKKSITSNLIQTLQLL